MVRPSPSNFVRRQEAESIRVRAEADAAAIVLKSDAEAKAHETLSAVINRDVIQLRSIEKMEMGSCRGSPAKRSPC